MNLFLFLFTSLFAAQSPELLLKKADDIRNPSNSYQMSIQVESEDGTSVFDVYLKGQDKTIIVTKEPSRDKGRNMLMLDREFQAYIPNLKRSMRLSLAQKLSGQVANGDISRTRWYGDYKPTIEKETAKEIQLFLVAEKDNLTYPAIRLWLDKSNDRPLRTEYLGSNKTTVLKKAYFENYKSLAGAIRPSTIRIEDANKKTSLIKIESMQAKNFEDSFFTVRNMESFK